MIQKLTEINRTIISLYSTESLYAGYLRVSYNRANMIFISIDTMLNDGREIINEAEIISIKVAYSELRIVLYSEIQSLNMFLITSKGPYDLNGLVDFGERIFPLGVEEKVPEALFDVRQAARCLAFELPTACGFHTFRALECVLRRYYAFSTGGKAEPKNRNISVYLNAMSQSNKGDSKIIGALKQISDLHRNPLVHPGTTLSMEEATSIVGVVRSVVSAMIQQLPSADLKPRDHSPAAPV